ncbi:MAG: uroporphyrinogen-III synthase [Pseudomonadota bacterium]|nr:uroporphyrinogen-III synthase [Pseudomonadota bacterium]
MTRPKASILITRPQPGADRFAQELRDALPCAVPMHVSPVIRIKPVPESLALDAVRGLIVTSEAAIPPLTQLTTRRDLPVFCVGTRARDAARATGFEAKTMGADADELVDAMLRFGPKSPLLHIRGEHARGNITGRLSTHGILTRDIVLYEQVAQCLDTQAIGLLEGTGPVVVPLFSPRSAALVAEQTSASGPRYVVAMSWAVAAELPRGWAKTTVIASRPDSVAMTQAVTGLFDTYGFLETGETRG